MKWLIKHWHRFKDWLRELEIKFVYFTCWTNDHHYKE